jgi:hypothetical protein
MDHRNCAINPNRPVARGSNTSPAAEFGGWLVLTPEGASSESSAKMLWVPGTRLVYSMGILDVDVALFMGERARRS